MVCSVSEFGAEESEGEQRLGSVRASGGGGDERVQLVGGDARGAPEQPTPSRQGRKGDRRLLRRHCQGR